MLSWKRLLWSLAWSAGAFLLTLEVYPLAVSAATRPVYSMRSFPFHWSWTDAPFYWKWHIGALLIYVLSPLIFGVYLALLAVKRWVWRPDRRMLMFLCLPTSIVTITVGVFVCCSVEASRPVAWLFNQFESIPLLSLLCGFSLITGLFETHETNKNANWEYPAVWCAIAVVLILFLNGITSRIAVLPIPIEIAFEIASLACGLCLGLFSSRFFRREIHWNRLVGIFLPMVAFYITCIVVFIENLNVRGFVPPPHGWSYFVLEYSTWSPTINYLSTTLVFSFIVALGRRGSR